MQNHIFVYRNQTDQDVIFYDTNEGGAVEFGGKEYIRHSAWDVPGAYRSMLNEIVVPWGHDYDMWRKVWPEIPVGAKRVE